MRNLGVGRAGLERHLIEDMDKFVEQIKEEILKTGGYEVNLQKKIDRFAGSTINRVMFGYTFEDVNFCGLRSIQKDITLTFIDLNVFVYVWME